METNGINGKGPKASIISSESGTKKYQSKVLI